MKGIEIYYELTNGRTLRVCMANPSDIKISENWIMYRRVNTCEGLKDTVEINKNNVVFTETREVDITENRVFYGKL